MIPIPQNINTFYSALFIQKRFRINTILIIESGCGIIWILAKNRTAEGSEWSDLHSSHYSEKNCQE